MRNGAPRDRASLYLAFRQAKAALFTERRGVGLVELAKFEENLGDRLARLSSRLAAQDGWFGGIDVGEVMLSPKKVEHEKEADPSLVTIGAQRENGPVRMQVRVQLSPSPEFACVEVLYLWEFGSALESVLSSDAVGYRLDIRDG